MYARKFAGEKMCADTVKYFAIYVYLFHFFFVAHFLLMECANGV